MQVSQVFPFPEALSEDQHETMRMLVDPIEKFFEVIDKFIKLWTNSKLSRYYFIKKFLHQKTY